MLYPATWLSAAKSSSSALILVNKVTNNVDRALQLAKFCEKRVLLDGASNFYAGKLINKGLTIDLAIGDGDSVSNESLALLKKNGVDFVYDKDQYATDMMKGIRYCKANWPEIKTVYIYNGYGGRVDHSWHSIYCLGFADRLGLELFIISDENITMLCNPGTTEVDTPLNLLGKTCGMAPLMGPSTITIRGFEWDVEDWETSFETKLSTSNHLVAPTVSITTNKPLAFTVEIRQ